MGGKTPTQQPTELEREQFAIAKQKFDRYLSEGVPVQNEYIRRTTGYRVADGKPVMDAGRVLQADGSVRTDAGVVQAQQARNLAGLQGGNPNSGTGRVGNVAGFAPLLAGQAGAVAQARTGQQDNWIKGVEGAIALGRGIEGEALQGLQGLAGTSAQQAQAAAEKAYTDREANKYLIGTAVGAGQGYLLKDFPKDRTPENGNLDAYLKQRWNGFTGYLNNGK